MSLTSAGPNEVLLWTQLQCIDVLPLPSTRLDVLHQGDADDLPPSLHSVDELLQVEEDPTSASFESEEQDLHDEVVMMQRPTSERGAAEDESDLVRSSTSRGRSAAVSGFSGETRNTDFDWVTTWRQVRQYYLCEYDRAGAPGHTQILVHLLALRRGATVTSGVYCPSWVLDDQAANYHISDWCEEYACQFDHAFTRAFPVLIELCQNVPATLVVQRLENSVLPLVVQVVIEVHQVHVVMRAQQYEYASEVIDWVHTQTQVRLPFEIYYQATRVDYWQQIEVRAGAVLQVRSRTQRELENPVQSTGETGPSLDQYSYTTWSSHGP